MLKNLENNGTEEIGLVTPTPDELSRWICVLSRKLCDQYVWTKHDTNIFSFTNIDGIVTATNWIEH